MIDKIRQNKEGVYRFTSGEETSVLYMSLFWLAWQLIGWVLSWRWHDTWTDGTGRRFNWNKSHREFMMERKAAVFLSFTDHMWQVEVIMTPVCPLWSPLCVCARVYVCVCVSQPGWWRWRAAGSGCSYCSASWLSTARPSKPVRLQLSLTDTWRLGWEKVTHSWQVYTITFQSVRNSVVKLLFQM